MPDGTSERDEPEAAVANVDAGTEQRSRQRKDDNLCQAS